MPTAHPQSHWSLLNEQNLKIITHLNVRSQGMKKKGNTVRSGRSTGISQSTSLLHLMEGEMLGRPGER